MRWMQKARQERNPRANLILNQVMQKYTDLQDPGACTWTFLQITNCTLLDKA